MKWISSISVAAFLLQAGYMPCAAQEVAPGARVGVLLDGSLPRRLGNGPRIFESSRIANIGKGALSGLIYGAGAGALAGLFWPLPDEEDCGLGNLVCSRSEAVAGLAFFGAIIGVGVGVLVGAVIPTEHRKIPIIERTRMRLSPRRHGGLALSTSLRF